MKTKKEIGEYLRTLRGEKTPNEVCSALNISRSALTMYETGKRIPRDEVKAKLAHYYKSSIESIFFN